MYYKRHQESWTNRVNNACLIVNPTQNDIQNTYAFCENFNDILTEFVHTSMQIHTCIKFAQPAIIVNTEESLAVMIQILKQQKFIFIDVINETIASYKGYITWLILATNTQLYLIDAAQLHDKCYELKQVLMRKNLIKFMHECQEVLFALKRDFQLFMPNIFDLEIIQRYLAKQGKVSNQSKAILKDFINSQPSYLISSRPLKQSLLSKVQEYYESEMSLLLHVDRFFATQDPEYQCYAYFNHYDLLLKSYFHHVPSVREFDQIQKMKHGLTENLFQQYSQHQEINLQKQAKKENPYWQKDSQEEEIARLFCEWRQHIAKMRDINVEQVLSYETLSKLAKTKINSILQISQICSNSYKHGIFSLSLEHFEQFFELFQLHKERKQQKAHELVIPRRIPYYKPNQERPIKQLFQELNFLDVGNDWLNNKNDESVRLYKEIVSINEFDNSIVEEYIKQMNISSNSHLSIEDITKYVKYAEYLRNGNHKKLQQLYERTKNKPQSQKNNDEYFEQNFILYEDQNNWDEVQKELIFSTMDNTRQPKSVQSFTSLRSISNNHLHSRGKLFNPKSTDNLNQKKFNSLRQLESPSLFQKVQPLPENIEAIYLEAAKAKKIYTTKIPKKSNKTGKKQQRINTDTTSKKQEQFIPTKEEIFNLIYY